MRSKLSRSIDLTLSLIIALTAIRNVGYGLFSCFFFEVIFHKGFMEIDVLKIQVFSLLGMIIFSLLWSKLPKFASINTLCISYLLKLISAIIYIYSDNLMLIALSGFLGFLPVTGSQNAFFKITEQTLLQNMDGHSSQNNENTSKFKKNLKTIQHISQMFGCLFVAHYMMKQRGLCFKFKNTISELATIYYYICAVEFLLCLVLKCSSSSINTTQTSISPAKKKLPSFLSFIRGFSQASLINTYLMLFLNEHYPFNHYFKICIILAGKCLLQAITPLLLKLSLFIFRKQLTICLNYLSNILLFLMMTHHVHVWIEAGAAYILAFVVLRKFDLHEAQYYQSSKERSLQTAVSSDCENERMRDLDERVVQDIGLTVGLAINYLFILQPTYSKLFFQPFINLGILSLFLKIYAYYKLNRIRRSERGQAIPIETDLESSSMINKQNQQK